ncbi:hypothetical protein LT493_37480 [Streptomyces tricolor]|nr:hypothetical protein [Streptomyces tricolor]
MTAPPYQPPQALGRLSLPGADLRRRRPAHRDRRRCPAAHRRRGRAGLGEHPGLHHSYEAVGDFHLGPGTLG